MVTFNRPAYLPQGDQSLVRAGMEGLTTGQPAHIDITGGKFTLINAGGEALNTISGAINVVVLDLNAHKSKVYYATSFGDTSDAQPPLCFSDNGVAPSKNAREPQNPTCGLCKWNIWGSAIGRGGKKVKACKDYKKIACFVLEEKSMQFLLRIPPNSFSYWTAYCGFVASQGADVSEIITKVSFADEPMTLNFEVAEANGQPVWVTPKFSEWYKAKLADHAWDDLIGRNDQPIDGALANLATPNVGAERNQTLPPARPQAPQSPVQALADPEPNPPAPPPAARRGRPPKSPTASGSPPVAAGGAETSNGQSPGFEAGPDLPEFLKRTSPGMVGDAPAPDAGLGAALDDMFGS